MKKILKTLMTGAYLSEEDAYETMLKLNHSETTDEQIVALMTALQYRGLQLNELIGFRKALLELALPVKLEAGQTIDVCGTGGDGKNTFNVSTTSAFVVASLGYKVVKHGNYGVSSLCGSSTVLETLGYQFTADESQLQQQLDKHNICFLHAPLFHPTLKRVAHLRKALGIPTFFNGIGPLVNPANPTHQLTGTYSLELAKHYQHVLHRTKKGYTVIHGMDGFDELTFIGSTRILSGNRDELMHKNPTGKPVSLTSIQGGNSAREAAKMLRAILKGKGTEAQNTVVAGNVALALQTFDPSLSYTEAFFTALEQLKSGVVFNHLQPNN
ncbi:MAG: anthranilate phosphoribosyltransferase [Candidatus Fluviicola riflensis]|nr:MAG: anthranilate phosphoribosyltransferase [Candidatus Fluviicola riflensis]OGS76882.1 MAG: anthranilate phosphoribosyltransferase [Candidatus Fluviicola riflensis]OGS81812.1 MAG: anthranilate phosphoribosyltransferase [Fluviicola sp. RIFCSPHIGHO2_01_FULL_43_53]OGS88611.1 MAG: anthranilate phosphoribosyltransferase [Fluviicola sp. RIFCSPHIGHO2_12_FULL_43_24]